MTIYFPLCAVLRPYLPIRHRRCGFSASDQARCERQVRPAWSGFCAVVVLLNPPQRCWSAALMKSSIDPTTGLPLGPFASGGGLNVAQMMAIGPDGNLYVASSKAPDTFVLRYDGTTGAPLPSTGNAGTAIFASGGGLTLPVGITFGPDGNLYVGDYGPSDFSFPSIRRYNGTTGAPMGVFASGGGLTNPAGIVFGPDGNLYVSNDLSGNSILRYNGSSAIRNGPVNGINTTHCSDGGPCRAFPACAFAVDVSLWAFSRPGCPACGCGWGRGPPRRPGRRDQQHANRQHPGQSRPGDQDRASNQHGHRPQPAGGKSEQQQPRSQYRQIPPRRRIALRADHQEVNPGVSGRPYRRAYGQKSCAHAAIIHTYRHCGSPEIGVWPPRVSLAHFAGRNCPQRQSARERAKRREAWDGR